MPYAALLDEAIKNSGITAKEIAARCKELGVELTPSYISLIRNSEKSRVPSRDISAALAKVLGKDENYFILEGYMDEAPEQLKKIIRAIYYQATLAALWISKTEINDDNKKAAQIYVQQKSWADIVGELSNVDNAYDFNSSDNGITSSSIAENGKSVNISLVVQQELSVNDDSMMPIMEKGNTAKIVVQDKYDDGDIIAFSINCGDIQFRKLKKINDDITLLLPFKNEYQVQVYDKENTAIIGKVVAVTKEL